MSQTILCEGGRKDHSTEVEKEKVK